MQGIIAEAASNVLFLLLLMPLNKHLSSLAVEQLSVIDAGREWRDFADPWMVWNYVRCVSGLVGAALLAVGLWKRRQQSSVAPTRRGGGQLGGVNPPVSG
jgi:uncharacterized membrane protein